MCICLSVCLSTCLVTLAALRPLCLWVSHLSVVRELQLEKKKLSTSKEGLLLLKRKSWVESQGMYRWQSLQAALSRQLKTHQSLDIDLSTGRMWLECWARVSAVGESSFPFQFRDRPPPSPYTLFRQDMARDLGWCLVQVCFSLPSTGWCSPGSWLLSNSDIPVFCAQCSLQAANNRSLSHLHLPINILG